jgi:hypothetical protein
MVLLCQTLGLTRLILDIGLRLLLPFALGMKTASQVSIVTSTLSPQSRLKLWRWLQAVFVELGQALEKLKAQNG